MGGFPHTPFCGETPHPLRKSTQKRQKINNNHEINHAEITNPDIDQETIQINKVLSCVTPKNLREPLWQCKKRRRNLFTYLIYGNNTIFNI